MTMRPTRLALVSLTAFAATSCGAQATGETAADARSTSAPSEVSAITGRDFSTKEHGTFNEAWAAAFVPGTEYLAITERGGTIKLRWPNGAIREVSGAPTVDYGGQGGLGDIAFIPSTGGDSSYPVYISWAEAGEGDTRGAVVGRGTLTINEMGEGSASITGLKVIWRQPKVSGRGHYSHRIAVSPDGK
ncbi:MAG: PQQ-dependent sugar dehydrogenase, partial [Tsuneonella sp.]